MAKNKMKDPNKVTFADRIRKPVFWYNIFAIPILLGAWNKFVHAIDNIGGIDGTKLLLTIGFMGEIIVFAIAAYVDTSEKDEKKKSSPGIEGGIELLAGEDKERLLKTLQQGADKVEKAFSNMALQIDNSTLAVSGKINPAFDELQHAAHGLANKIDGVDLRTGTVNLELLAQNAASLQGEFNKLVETLQTMNTSMTQVQGSVNPGSYSTMNSNMIEMNSTIEQVNKKMRELEAFLDGFQNLRKS